MKAVGIVFTIGMVWQLIEAVAAIVLPSMKLEFLRPLIMAALCFAGAALANWLAAAEEDRKKQLEILTEIRDTLKPKDEKTE